MEVLEIALDQCGPATERKLAIVDKNRDLFLTSVRIFGTERKSTKMGKNSCQKNEEEEKEFIFKDCYFFIINLFPVTLFVIINLFPVTFPVTYYCLGAVPPASLVPLVPCQRFDTPELNDSISLLKNNTYRV